MSADTELHRGLPRSPTERQAAFAARQLHYHREKLRWIQDRMSQNEDLLRLYLTYLDTNTTVLPGGFRVGCNPAITQELAIEKLTPKNLYEQLTLPVEQRDIA